MLAGPLSITTAQIYITKFSSAVIASVDKATNYSTILPDLVLLYEGYSTEHQQ